MPRLSYLASPRDTASVLKRHGFTLKKSFGQNFLINDSIIQKIAALAKVREGESILEVGPGIGTLTAGLLASGCSVVAIERDPSLYEVLDDTLAAWKGNFGLIKRDALRVDARDISSACEAIGVGLPSKFVANLPYAVAATIILDFLKSFAFLESATVMVQKEVAERISAKPGTKNYGAYTVKLSMFAEVAGSFQVSPGNFMPPPHVDSSVIRLNRCIVADENGDEISADAVNAACSMADAAFYQRRKTILNSCKQFFSSRGEQVDVPAILESAGIDPARRGETLSRQEFLNLGSPYLLLH